MIRVYTDCVKGLVEPYNFALYFAVIFLKAVLYCMCGILYHCIIASVTFAAEVWWKFWAPETILMKIHALRSVLTVLSAVLNSWHAGSIDPSVFLLETAMKD